MKLKYKILTIISAIFLLTGCGTTKTVLKPDATNNIKKIALIQVAEPPTYIANDFGNVGMMFGGVGAAVAGSSSANATKGVEGLAAEAKFKAGKNFTTQLKKKLSSSGYQIKLISVSRPEKLKLLEKYDSVDAGDADAILDVVIQNIGYATEHPMLSPHWRPASQIQVALVDSRSGNTIYSEKFMYGYHNPFLSGTDIDAPEMFHFKNNEELFKDSKKLVRGMAHSIDAVTNQIADTLKK